jgi:hypothetical protein
MSGIAERQERGPQGWSLPSACASAEVKAGVVLAVVLAVMAGLLAMHALITGHAGSGSSDHHVTGHVHAEAITDTTAGFAMVPATTARAVAESASAGLTTIESESPGHGLCPDAGPGHCPHLPALMSMCQAVLSGAGMMLLLLLVMLALAGQRTVWTALLAVSTLVRAPHGEWSAWRRRLRPDGPSLLELCIIRC